jgi:hypothetical protein
VHVPNSILKTSRNPSYPSFVARMTGRMPRRHPTAADDPSSDLRLSNFESWIETSTAGNGGKVVDRQSGLLPDSSGRHEFRYFDGTSWAEKVADHAVAAAEPISGRSRPSPNWSTQASTLGSRFALCPPVNGG